MKTFSKGITVFLNSILAGIAISIGCIAYLMVNRGPLGAVLFSVGLFIICTLRLNLFTGKVCYTFDMKDTRESIKYFFWCILIYIGNFVGTFITSVAVNHTRLNLLQFATQMVETKLNDNYLSLFILGVFCNILIYLAVDNYRRFSDLNNELRAFASIIIFVTIFVVCNFEHCIADTFYFNLVNVWSVDTLIKLGFITLGNIFGGTFIPLLQKLIQSVQKNY